MILRFWEDAGVDGRRWLPSEVKDSPGKEEVSSGGPAATLLCNCRSDKRSPSQVANHSAEGSNVAEGRQVEDTGGSLVDTYSSEGGTGEKHP